MTDTDEIARLRALWCEEKSKAMTFHAEIERLRAEVDALKAEVVQRSETVASLLHRIALIREAAGCEGVMLGDLPREVATLKAERDEAFKSAINTALRVDDPQPDPLAEMWRELSEYQEQADRDGHGESWAAMCRDRTATAAWSAYGAVSGPYSVESAPLWASRAAANAARAENAGNYAQDAIDEIRRAKEVQR
jgi:hypothetical protein